MSRRLILGLAAGLALVALSTLGSECDPQTTHEVALYRVTGPPPTRTAEIREEDGAGTPPRIRLSLGVVLAARCWDTCDYTCEEPVVTVVDPSILTVRTIDRLDRLTPDFALVAASAGSTNLTLETGCTSKTYLVEVLAN